MGLFDAGARRHQPATVHERVLTVPNAVSGARLLALPVFVWLVLGPERHGVAFALLAVVATSDWIDGYLARRLDQASRLGAVADPLIDRALLVTTAITLLLAGLVPALLVVAIVARDVVLVSASFALFGAVPPMRVNRTGKTATAALLAALPLFLLGGAVVGASGRWVVAVAWVLAVAGVALYYVAGAHYARAAWHLRRAGAAGGGPARGRRGPAR